MRNRKSTRKKPQIKVIITKKSNKKNTKDLIEKSIKTRISKTNTNLLNCILIHQELYDKIKENSQAGELIEIITEHFINHTDYSDNEIKNIIIESSDLSLDENTIQSIKNKNEIELFFFYIYISECANLETFHFSTVDSLILKITNELQIINFNYELSNGRLNLSDLINDAEDHLNDALAISNKLNFIDIDSESINFITEKTSTIELFRNIISIPDEIKYQFYFLKASLLYTEVVINKSSHTESLYCFEKLKKSHSNYKHRLKKKCLGKKSMSYMLSMTAINALQSMSDGTRIEKSEIIERLILAEYIKEKVIKSNME
ncbi:MAG: hypothetical protein ACTH6Y_13145 [Vibrio hibernica]